MALNVWTQPSGYSFGVYEERKSLDISLPVVNDSGTTYSRISGIIPSGLRIQGNHLVGIPFEVPRLTEYTFCIRASNAQGIADRTFKISIDGADTPTFVTGSGLLPIGPAQQFYILDSSYVEYQIDAIDQDTSVGQKLSYFIADNDGALPPGLVLTQDGRITGFIQPALAIRPEDGSGTYDDTYYDAVAYDFAVLPSNGYDSYIYDSVFYGYNIATNLPKKLNRTYEFTVTVTDTAIPTITCPGNMAINSNTIFFENFETGATGWSNNTTETDPATTRILGRFGGSAGITDRCIRQ
jgi:hypothetical protein